jgi:LPS-assembly lipoprotein
VDARDARRRLLRAGALAALAAAAPGCGFQLRGTAGLPFRTLYAGFPPTSAIGADFRRLVRISGETQLVERPDAAQARLEVLGEAREKEIVGFSSTGRPREYQLRQRFVFRLLDAKGQELIAPTTLLLRRDITTTDTQIVSKEQEEALLYREMQTDVVQQLLRRLAAVKLPGA